MSQEKKATLVEPRKVTRIRELVEIIERDGEVTPQEIAAEMNLPLSRVYTMVSYQNLRHLDNQEKYPHIYNTGSGYSIHQRKEYSIFETGRRMKQSHGILSRGIPAFAHCRIVAPEHFENLRVTYNPSAQKLVKLLSSNGNKK